MSVSRSAGSYRSSEDEARRQKVLAQQKYAQELHEQQSARLKAEQTPTDRKRIQRRAPSPVQASSILSSPTSMYTSAGGVRTGNGGSLPLTDREKERQKKREYFQQLEADKQSKASETPRESRLSQRQRPQSPIQQSNILSSPTSMYTSVGGRKGNEQPMTDREKARLKQQEYFRQLEADEQLKATNSGYEKPITSRQRPVSPIMTGDNIAPSAGMNSERNMKHQRQLEYAAQLKRDMEQKDILSENAHNSSRVQQRTYRSPKGESDFGANFGNHQSKLTRREMQDNYAREIREASEKKEIITPRRALSARRLRNSGNNNSESGGTGLVLGNNIGTAAQLASKRDRQSKYREELNAAAKSQPITSSRVSLRSNRSRQDDGLDMQGGGVSGFSTAGLIGKQESEQERLRKKIENQKRYYNQLQTDPSITRGEPRYGNEDAQISYDPPLRQEYNDTEEIYDYSRSQLHRSHVESDPSPNYHPNSRFEPQSRENVYSTNYNNEVSHGTREEDTGGPPRQVSFDNLGSMLSQSQQRIEESHYSPTKPVVTEDGKISFDGINPPYGRHNKGMNVPNSEGKMPSPRHIQRPQYQVQPSSHEMHHKQEYRQDARGTSLIIGNMEACSADDRGRKVYEQQKFVQELEKEKNRVPIQDERVSLIQLNKYQGNGLPGSEALQSGNYYQRGTSHPRNDYREHPYAPSPQYAGHRGTSTGGGASSIVLGGGYGAEKSPRMRRKGAPEEYAAQIQYQRQPQELYHEHQQYYRQN